MPEKTEYLNLRINPAFKEALRKAAEIEHRSVANMVEILIRDHCRKTGIDIEPMPVSAGLAVSKKKQPKAKR